MSHEETLKRMNAEMNTPASWERRWQIEREDNERLNAVANMVRTGVHGLLATCAKGGLRAEAWRAGYAAALRDVMELMETAEDGSDSRRDAEARRGN